MNDRWTAASVLRCSAPDETPEGRRSFAAVMEDLATRYRLVTLTELLSGAPCDDRVAAIALTFDSGAFTPAARMVLENAGVPATVFLRTGGIAGGTLAVPGVVERSVRDWDDVHRLAAAGFEIGSAGHSGDPEAASNAILAHDELQQSRALLEDALGAWVGSFAYPDLWCPGRRRSDVADTGFEIAVTGNPGIWTIGDDPLTVPRLPLTAGTTPQGVPPLPAWVKRRPRPKTLARRHRATIGTHADATPASALPSQSRQTAATSSFRRLMADLDLDSGVVRHPAGAIPVPAPARTRVIVRRRGHPLGEVMVTSAPGVDAGTVADAARSAAVREFGAVGAPPAFGAPADAPMVSVIVTTMDNEVRCAATVRQIVAGQWPDLEVLVVDNRPRASRTHAFFAAEGLLDDGRVRVLDEYRQGLSSARNCGLRQARGEVVLVTDDDVTVDEAWVPAMLAPFLADPDVACVTGTILPLELETPAQQWLEEYGGYHKGYARQVYDMGEHRREDVLYPFDAGRFGSGANLAFRAAVLRELGGFAEELGAGTPARGGEDLDIFLRTVLAGHRLVYEPGSILWHSHRRSAAALHRHLYGYGVGLSATMTRWLIELPTARRGMLLRGVAGLRHLASADSSKNATKLSSFPRELTRQELRGVVAGPWQWWRSHRRYHRRG